MQSHSNNRSLDTLLQDVRYTFRTLRRNAGFTTFATLIVGLGIGASSTVFSVVNALLLRPLPFTDPNRLVWISNHDTSGLSGQTTQVGHFLDLRERNRSFSDLAAYFAFYGVGDNKLTGLGEPERLSGVPVSQNFFPLLGVQPQLGRLFNDDECKWHGPKAVLLSHGLWERRFASDPAIVGRPLTLNDEAVMVIGVMPASFDFATVFAPGSHIDLYFPFPLTAETNRWGNTLAIVGRLKPGVSAAGAQAELTVLAKQITDAHRDRNNFEGKLSLLGEHVSGNIQPALFVLASAVCVVMLIVCANLSNLLLALHVPGTALHDALKETNRGSTEGQRRHWIRSSLVVSEVAFACVLLVGAGLLIRSFLRVLDVNMGFRPERAAAIRVDPDRQYSTQAQQNAYFDDVLRRVKDVPGIEAAGLSDALPLGRNRSWGAPAKGQVYAKGKFPDAFVRVVTDGYIKAMGIPVRAGRDISERDTPSTEPVILINETMARTLFPGEDALGKIMKVNGERRVIGVVGDVRHLALEQGAGMEMYLPIRQCRDWASLDLVVRTTLPPSQLASAVRAALKPIQPNLPGNDFRSLQQLVDKAVSPRRFVVLLLGGFALFALVLASLGIYGVISYSVSQRTQEIGIRMALGASAVNLQMRIILQTLGLAAVGMLVGMGASWALARALRGFLFGVTSTDPVTFAAILIL